jgi:hypothetical protein
LDLTEEQVRAAAAAAAAAAEYIRS